MSRVSVYVKNADKFIEFLKENNIKEINENTLDFIKENFTIELGIDIG